MAPKNASVAHLEAANVRMATFHDFKLKSSDTAVSWPYKTPSPEFMAKSGFYFTPTKRLKDRITCFSCEKTQSTWKSVKDPALHHLKKYPNCYYSKLQHLNNERATNSEFKWSEVEIFNDPMSEEATSIRLKTFGSNWPYDHVKDANPTSEKMVDAGFCYYPQDQDDDLAMCMYCAVSLEGWEKDDDPMMEHRKRATDNNCYFLKMLDSDKHQRKEIQHGIQVNEEEEEEMEEELNSLKRSSSVDLVSSLGAKKQKHEAVSDKDESKVDDNDDSLPLRGRPRRVRKVVKKLDIDLSSGDDMNSDEDESFGITANDEKLNSEEEYFESSQKRSSKVLNKSKSNSTITMKSNTRSKVPSSPPLKSPSPLKKSKILDSSFDNDTGIFASNKLKDLDMNLLPEVKLRPKNNKNSKTLQDITNITNSNSASPKKSQHSTKITSSRSISMNESEDEDDIILVSNSKESISEGSISHASNNEEADPVQQNLDPSEKHTINKPHQENKSLSPSKEQHVSNNISDEEFSKELAQHSKASSMETLKRDAIIEKDQQKEQDLQAVSKNQEEHLLASQSSSSSFANIHPSPLVSKYQNSPLKSDQLDSNTSSKPDVKLNKSIISQTRFHESPRRSQSPFLDHDYEGSDYIEPLPLPQTSTHNFNLNEDRNSSLDDPNDIPIEESTDNNIKITDISFNKNDTSKSLENISKVTGTKDEDLKASSDEASFHSAEQSQIQDWQPTDMNKLFQSIEDLETAKEYLSSLKDLPYDLNDDIDGRVSYFINEMPNEELDMSIKEWIMFTAKQGKTHLRSLCERMIEQFDEESNRALDRIKALDTK